MDDFMRWEEPDVDLLNRLVRHASMAAAIGRVMEPVSRRTPSHPQTG